MLTIPAGARFLEVGLQEVKPALELLAIGFSLPLFLLILEILMRKAAILRGKHEKRLRFNMKAFTTGEIQSWK